VRLRIVFWVVWRWSTDQRPRIGWGPGGVSVVELAGLEPASRKHQPSVLHAYFVIYLTISNSDKQDFS